MIALVPIALALAPLAPLLLVPATKERAVLHPHVLRLFDERDPAKVWVFLRDKGRRSAHDVRIALGEAEAALHPRARSRRERRRSAPGLVDLRDVPIYGGYVERVTATGAELVRSSRWLNALSVRASRDELEAIAALDCVVRIEPVRRGARVRGREAETDELQPQRAAGASLGGSSLWGASAAQLELLKLTRLHDAGFTGEGVTIGVLDSGFFRGHQAFNQPGHVLSVVAEYDFVDDDGNTSYEPGDDPAQHVHGTWVLGALGAYLPGELIGAAYDADFILCKTEDETNEYAQEEDFYVSGLEFIEANGGDVATGSVSFLAWYTQDDLDGLTAVSTIAVNVATSNGVHCCTVAGNFGHDADPTTSSLAPPGDAFDVITVGAVDPTGATAFFSSDGPTADGRVKPELVAPGHPAWTVCPSAVNTCLQAVSGTSLSTPLVAGAVACLVQAHPEWGVGELRARLFANGTDFVANGTFDPAFVRGFGIPNVFRTGLLGKLASKRLFLPSDVKR